MSFPIGYNPSGVLNSEVASNDNRLTDPTTGAGLFTTNTDPNVVGIDPLTNAPAPVGTDVGFGSFAVGYLRTGLYNSTFAVPPPQTSLPINSDTSSASYNPLPGWNLVDLSNGAITATWQAGQVNWAMAAGAAGDKAYLEQKVPWASYTGVPVFMAANGDSSNTDVTLEAQFLTSDAVTTIGAAGTSSSTGGLNQVVWPGGDGTANGGIYLRVRVGVARDGGAAASATGSGATVQVTALAFPYVTRLGSSTWLAEQASLSLTPPSQMRAIYASTDGHLYQKDSSSNLHMLDSMAGRTAYAFVNGLSAESVSGASSALAAVSAGLGGALAEQMFFPSPMAIQALYIWATDTATARSFEWALYEDVGSNTLQRVAGTQGSASYTPSVAAAQGGNVTTPGTLLRAGTYFLVVRNTSTTQTLGFGRTTTGSFISSTVNLKRTSTTAALGATIDISAWTQVATGPHLAAAAGRIGAESAAF